MSRLISRLSGLAHSVTLTFIYCCMIVRKKKITRKKASRKKGAVFVGIARLCSFLFLLIFLVFSVCTVGYVIFFRTVFAQDILPAIKSAIVFEEPDPPVDLEQVAEEKGVPEPDLPKVAIIIDDMGYHESIGKELLVIHLRHKNQNSRNVSRRYPMLLG